LGDDQEETALHVAASAGNAGVVSLLMEAKADPEQKNIEGKSATDLAHDNNNGNLSLLMLRGVQQQSKFGNLLPARKSLCLPRSCGGSMATGC